METENNQYYTANTPPIANGRHVYVHHCVIWQLNYSKTGKACLTVFTLTNGLRPVKLLANLRLMIVSTTLT